MKGKSIFKTVFISILVVVLCTWIFPSTSFKTALIEEGRVQVGLFDLFSYPMVAVTYFAYTLLYVAVIGIFYGVMNKISAYQALIEKIKTSFVGREHIFLITVMILISVLVSVTGLSFGMIFVFPFVCSIILAMGYNKLVAASVTVGSTISGIAGTTLGNNTVSYMNQLLGTDIMNEMVSKVVVLIAFMIVLIANVLLYAKKTKTSVIEAKKEETVKKEKIVSRVRTAKEVDKVSSQSVVSKKNNMKKAENNASNVKKTVSKTNSTKKADTKTTKQVTTKVKNTKTRASMAKTEDVIKVKNTDEKKVIIWPLILIFDLVLIILCISVFDWAGIFNVNWFANAKEAVTEFEIFGFPIFSKLLGRVSEFGLWSLNVELLALILIATVVLMLVYRVKWNDFIEGVVEGLQKSVTPACCMILAYVVLVIVTYHPFQLGFTKFLLDLTSGFNVVTMSIAAMLASIFNVESVYTAQSTLPYVMSVITDSSLYPLIEVIFQSIYGLMMLVAPTSVILIGTLSYLDISYGQWLKHIWKIFVELLIILLIIFLIILAI
ncbi:MAG: hypothetical protein PUB18_05705 [bacterium]|nr:hypothetical protein [bacterium]